MTILEFLNAGIREEKKEMWYFLLILSSIMTPRYLTWSFCAREEMVPSLVGKINGWQDYDYD